MFEEMEKGARRDEVVVAVVVDELSRVGKLQFDLPALRA